MVNAVCFFYFRCFMIDMHEIQVRIAFILTLSVLLIGCRNRPSPEQTLFQLLKASETGVDFTNTLDYTEEVNTYTFRNFYNGGGVGIGDFNNDSLPDIIFAGNLVDNKLYINEGDFRFRDVSEKSGVVRTGSWTTGISVVDINGDGWLDIYLCKSGPPGGPFRHNELLINNGDLTFTESSAQYGLDYEGLAVHAAFFDFDKDGDLDCYLLNNSIRSVGGYDLRKDQRNIPDTLGGNKLLRNDNGRFVDVSQEAGIYTSAIGFGLGVTIGDINMDGWPDVYVSNDFFERDYLYINNGDGTFRESLEQYIREISLGSMGADMADINNDGLPEIFVTEMLPEKDARLKTTSQFENWEKYSLNVAQGYYRQFSRNVLQLNNGDTTFSEIARLARVEATDWSWGALIFDMDNDGWKDIFVANGIYKDLIDQDYVNFIANQALVRKMIQSGEDVLTRLIDSIPSNKIPNYAFHNRGDLTFTNKSAEWGLAEASHSNGSAYADLDNDGDLDLVISNVNMPAFVIRNDARQRHPENASISVSLVGDSKNTYALGSKVTIVAGGKRQYQELAPMRGFMSSVDYKLVFGLGPASTVDTLLVDWPDGRVTLLTNLPVNQRVVVDQNNAVPRDVGRKEVSPATTFRRLASLPGVDFVHRENDFVDFNRERLLFHMRSNEGPCLCTGDFNNDGREDFYIGGARGQAGRLYVQGSSGTFRTLGDLHFDEDASSEDTGCLLFDANGDGYPDLYVTSGSSEFSSSSSALRDRLYFNVGGRSLKKSGQLLPTASRFESTSVVQAADVDGDGDLDLFVGVRLVPFLHGVPGNGYILLNDGNGNFEDATSRLAPGLLPVGMITGAKWVDVNQDDLPDLVVVGEWMPVKLFINRGGLLEDQSHAYGFDNTEGWYHTVEVADVNNDGWIDLIVGNHGLNSRFRATVDEPVTMYVNDFDQNGTLEQIITQYQDGMAYPMVLRHDLVTQLPGLKKKYLHFRDYSDQSVTDIFTPAQLDNALVVQARSFETAVWVNTGKGSFERKDLPTDAQFSPVYAILPVDFDEDGNMDLLMGGNLYRAKPEAGIYDASYGVLLKGDGKGKFEAVPSVKSGVCIKGEVRSMQRISADEKRLVLVALNNEAPAVLIY